MLSNLKIVKAREFAMINYIKLGYLHESPDGHTSVLHIKDSLNNSEYALKLIGPLWSAPKNLSKKRVSQLKF